MASCGFLLIQKITQKIVLFLLNVPRQGMSVIGLSGYTFLTLFSVWSKWLVGCILDLQFVRSTDYGIEEL